MHRLPLRWYLTNLSLVKMARMREVRVGPGAHAVSSMVGFGAGFLVLLSASIFLVHAIAAYRAQ
jgi:hypothetical protein